MCDKSELAESYNPCKGLILCDARNWIELKLYPKTMLSTLQVNSDKKINCN